METAHKEFQFPFLEVSLPFFDVVLGSLNQTLSVLKIPLFFIKMSEFYCISPDYIIRPNPRHHDDTNLTDGWQKEVYEFVRDFMKEKGFQDVIDVGCGSGYKLVHVLGEFKTYGIETEPCLSLLKEWYPSRMWFDSGKCEEDFQLFEELKEKDIVICSDVIEHIINPDKLVEFLQSLKAKYYVISTPCREVLVRESGIPNGGPPFSDAHVREWTFEEFKMYLSKHFNVLSSVLCPIQRECQYHLVQLKDGCGAD